MKSVQRPFVLLLAALFFVFLFAGCGQGKGSASSAAYSQIGQSEESASQTSSESSATASAPSDASQVSSEPQSSELESSEPESSEPGDSVVAEGDRVDGPYFDDAVFVGDSVSLKLEYYVLQQRAAGDCLGNAQFLTSGSLGSGNAQWDLSNEESVHPSYQGEPMLIEDAVALMGAKKIYIMLGMNDIGMYGVDDSLANYKSLVDKILENSPDAAIFAQSVTPMSENSQLAGSGLNNTTIAKYDEKLKELSEQEGWHYLDVAAVLDDGTGFLPREYCSDPDDMGIHFTEQACDLWIDYLYTHTA